MTDVRISWDLPTTREDGTELLLTDIGSVEVSASADGGNSFAVLNTVPPASGNNELLVSAVDVGDWIFRLVVLDLNTPVRRSAAIDAAIYVPSQALPGTVLNVMLTLETI